MTAETVLLGCCVGVAATVTMDVLASVSRKIGLTVGAKGIWVGRWYLGMAQGQFVHSNIADVPERPGEKRAAQVGHYAIGVVLAIFYFAACCWLGLSPGNFLVALGYGLATCVFPWFMLFPALGLGWFGLKAPPELKVVRTSLLNHLSYGVGLWWSAAVLGLG